MIKTNKDIYLETVRLKLKIAGKINTSEVIFRSIFNPLRYAI